MIVLLIPISLGVVFLYEPQSGERWDFLILILFFLGIKIFTGNQKIYSKPLLIFAVGLQLLCSVELFFDRVLANDAVFDKVQSSRYEWQESSQKGVTILPYEFFKYNAYLLSHSFRGEKNIYFYDKDLLKVYQAPGSFWAKDLMSQDDLFSYHFFGENMSDSQKEELSVSSGIICIEKSYIYPTLEEHIKNFCTPRDK